MIKFVFFIALLSQHLVFGNHQLFTQDAYGNYVLVANHDEQGELTCVYDNAVPVKKTVVRVDQKKTSRLDQFKQWLRSPYNISLPIIGSIKKLYNQIDECITRESYELYVGCIQNFFAAKNQLMSYQAFEFAASMKEIALQMGLRWLTPAGIADYLFYTFVRSQITTCTENQNINYSLRCFADGVYYTLTRTIAIQWFVIARIYEYSMQPWLHTKMHIPRLLEWVMVNFFVPSMGIYIPLN